MRKRKLTSIESIALGNLKQGDSFFTTKKDNVITAAAGHYDIKISTERLIAINPVTTETVKILKVTII